MSTPAVEIENLTKIYPIPLRRQRVVAVQKLAFTVQPGDRSGFGSWTGGATEARTVDDVVIPPWSEHPGERLPSLGYARRTVTDPTPRAGGSSTRGGLEALNRTVLKTAPNSPPPRPG